MDLFVHELMHLAVSLLTGYLVWQHYKKPLPAFTAALLGGFFIDADHLFDYFLVFGPHFNIHTFFFNLQFMISKKVYVPFHAWEWVIIMIIIYNKQIKKLGNKKNKFNKTILSFILALLLGVYSHLIIDTMTNNVVPLGYSIIFRAINNFDALKISKNFF